MGGKHSVTYFIKDLLDYKNESFETHIFSDIDEKMEDDTTKIIYGMKTTSFISKEKFLLSDTLFLILDSTLNDIYNISIPEKNQFKYQNLGNLKFLSYLHLLK